MADNTPVTREEYYLAKAGGQNVPVPSAVTREEYYLEKLSNDNVDVPTPVTRREKFLYFACGGEIDLPSEEKMTRLERLIAKAGGMDVSTPTAVTRLEKLWANVEGGGWKTLTGVLPLTFTAKGGNAVDWTIYGNDENGTENLVSPIRTANGWKQGYRQKINGNYSTTHNSGEWLYDVYIPIDSANFTFWATSVSGPESGTFYFFDNNKDYLTNTAIDINNYNNAAISNLPANAAYMQFAFRAFCMTEQEIINKNYQVMLVKGSSAPDHYIPYQQGVGERTKNKLPVPVNGVYSANRTTVTVTDGVYHIVQTEGSGSSSVYIDLPEFEVPDSGYINYLNSMAFATAVVVLRYNNASLSNGYVLTPINRAVAIGSDYAGKKVNQIQIYTTGNATLDFTIAPMITDSNTYTTYISYGYQIPLIVSQQGQTDKNYDIYIGDSPLTEGETVSKTSTGVDIELFDGENTVSTTLYNKPAMEIKYK